MDPVTFALAKPAINNDVKHASSDRDVSINSVSFIKSLGEVAAAQKMVITDGSKPAELNIKRSLDGSWGEKTEEVENEEDKILGFLNRIKKILEKKNK